MTRTVPFHCLLSVLLFLPSGLFAQDVNGAGSTSTNFQKIGMGARAAGMGESFTAVADDSTAIFWNPAGLNLAKGTQFSLTHGEWLLGVTHEFFTVSHNMDKDGAFGGSVGYLGTGNFPGALENPLDGSYNGVGPDISATNYAGSIAYAQRLGNWLNGDFFKRSMVGLKATVVGQDVVNVGSTGVAFDLGYLYEVERKKFFIGALLSNVGTQIQDFSQPLMYKLGGSYRFSNLLTKRDRNTVAVDLDGHIDTGFKFKIGDEYRLSFGQSAAFLRLGYRTGSDLGTLAGLTSGIGVSHRFSDFVAALDYAFVPYGVLGQTHRVTLSLATGGILAKPQAYLSAPTAFTLAQQSLPVRLAAKSEDPIDRWKLTVADVEGRLVRTYEGKGNPPGQVIWDGKDQAGKLVPQGNYTFALEVTSDEELSGASKPRDAYAKWVPKKVPYEYNFQVPGDMLFDSGKAELLQRGYEAIRKAAEAIARRYPHSQIVVAGHTDDQRLAPSAKYRDNRELSLARAQAVVDFLTANGMKPQQLSVVGYGETKPIASNRTPEGRSKNRRVELVVSGVAVATATEIIRDGQILFRQGNYREALNRFLKAIESDSRSALAYQLAGDCYLRLGGKTQAVKAYQKSLELEPQNTLLRQWMDRYAPGSAPAAPAAPSQPPVSQPAPPAAPGAPPAAAPAPQAQSPAPASQPAEAGAPPVPIPVEAN